VERLVALQGYVARNILYKDISYIDISRCTNERSVYFSTFSCLSFATAALCTWQ